MTRCCQSAAGGLRRRRRSRARRGSRAWRPDLDGPGTYVLVFRVPQDVCLRVGSLGEHRIGAGCYAYVGSAFGPGGLRARLARHLRRGGRRHWHIDALKQVARAREAWVSRSRVSLEHAWAARLLRMPGIRIPIQRFGASDCDCRGHLFRVGRRLLRVALRRLGAQPVCLPAARASFRRQGRQGSICMKRQGYL